MRAPSYICDTCGERTKYGLLHCCMDNATATMHVELRFKVGEPSPTLTFPAGYFESLLKPS